MKSLNKNIYIFSIKFSPGLFKEFYLIGKKLSSNNNVFYFISENYKFLHKEFIKNQTQKQIFEFLFKSNNIKNIFLDTLQYIFFRKNNISSRFIKNKPDIVFIYNSHPINFLIFTLAKKINPNCRNILFVHEPYRKEKRVFGFLGFFYFYLQEFFQSISFKKVQSVILPSPLAKKIFLSRYQWFRGNIYNVNLLLNDEPHVNLERKYFTFGGGLNKGKGLKEFIDLVNYTAIKKLDHKFKIITSNKIEKYLSNLSEDGRKMLIIENRKDITDFEMYKIHAESIAFFLLHKNATQSGAMPVSFMHGTPIIAKNMEAFSQYIKHKTNSYLLPVNFETIDLFEAMKFVIKNNKKLSLNARKTYLEEFSDLNFKNMYDQIFK